jgi:hypothetical protein
MLPSPSRFIQPCLLTPSRTVPDGPRWAFEVKHDGYRFIARRDGDRVRVLFGGHRVCFRRHRMRLRGRHAAEREQQPRDDRIGERN